MIKRNKNQPGYKKTKIGWIPDNWDCEKLKRITTLITNGFVGKATSHYSECDDSVIYVQGYNVKSNRIEWKGIKRVTKDFHQRQKRSELKLNDLLTIQTGEIGVSVLVPEELVNANCHALIITRFQKDKASPFYYVQFFNSIFGKKILNHISTGSILKHINAGDLKNLYLPIPPLGEQKKIAQILSTWDGAIEQTNKLIKAKKKLKKGLMQNLLTGQLRFPQFVKSNNYIETHFYNCPVDWKHLRIFQIAKEVNVRNDDGGELTVLSCSKYEGFVNSLEYFGKKVYSDDTTNYKIISKYQFGFPANHIEEGSIGLLTHVEEGILSPIYIVFVVDHDKVYPPFLYSLFKTETYRHIFSVSTNASVDRRGSLRWVEFSKIRIPLPSLTEQKVIYETLDKCESEINLLLKKQRFLENQKKGLMQKLLTGEIRVSVN